MSARKPAVVNEKIGRASALSQLEGLPAPVKGRMVAILAADGVNVNEMMQMARALDKAGIKCELIAPHGGFLKGNNGSEPLQVDKTFLTSDSIFYDAVYIPGGANSVQALQMDGEALHFVQEAYKHCKAICATREGALLVQSAGLPKVADPGQDSALIVAPNVSGMSAVAEQFLTAMSMHRNFMRVGKKLVTA